MATKNESPYKPFSGPFQSNPNDFRQYLQEQKQKQAQQKKEQEEKQKNSSGGWLHAPYNIIVEPHKTKDGKTEGGGNYEEARKKYDELRARVVDTGEASNLRKTWGSTPQIELKNGKLTLKGSKEFLESSTAKQLRDVFKEMKGKTYNTEALNKQVEAWNTDLQKMSDTYLANLEGYNALNQAVASTYSMQGSENREFKPYSFNEYLKIANSMRLGKESNAANLDDLIFVGYEWDDNGNRKEKWVKAKDFYEEFNSIADKDKRKALHSLITQSQNGDAGAMSRLYYLTGGKDTPANITYGATSRINDFFDTFTKNAYVGFAEAADFVTTYVPFFNTMRLTGRAVNAASEGGWNWNKFFEADDTRKKIDDYEDLVTWENAYRMELTPGSTQAASIAGNVVGGVLGMAYSIWAGGVGNEAAVQGVSRAISSAGNALRQTGNFVEYTYTINVESGKLQQVRVMSNGMQLGTVPIGAAATGGSVSQSVLIPTALAKKFPNFAAKFAEVSAQVGARSKLMMQFGNMTEAGQNIARVTSTAGKGSILGAADIAKLRMQSRGLQTAINLYILGNESAIRHVDQYFRRTQEGEDLGDMGQYLIDNVGRDVIIGGAMYGAGMTIRGLKNIVKNSRIPASRNYEVYETMATNSQSGFYNAGSKYNVQPLMLGTGGPTIDTDVARTVGTIMTVNGEPFFVSPTTSGLVSSAIPGSELAGQAFGFVSNNKVNTVTVEPAVGGFNVVTTSIPNDGGTSITTKSFYENLDEANLAAKKAGVPSVNAKTLANSDMALTGNVVPFSVDELSAIRYLPTGVSRIKFTPKISYLTPDEYILEVNDVVAGLAPDLRRAYEAALGPNISAEGVDAISQQIYAKDGPLLAAPRLFVPRTETEAVELARGVGKAMAVKQMNPGSSPIVPVQTEPDDVEKRTPRNIVVTENGLPRKWFSDMDEAIKYKDELGTRGIYKVDESQIVLDRPPVTMDNIYYPAVRGANGVATIDEIDMGGAAPNTTDAIAKFNDAMASLPLLKESPEDYAQGVLDVVQQVKAVYNEVSRFVDMDKTYEEYARQIAEGAEQPTVNDYAKETLEPLSNMLTALGKYFDPSGKSLTKEFYLPTGGKSTKLMSVEDAIAHPEKTVDVDTPVDASFDNILVDPLRIGSSGFWEKRTGELFLDEDGNFTMAKSGSLEENLIAYTVSALTRGENRLSVAANNEVALSKFDKNRNPITSKQALDGLKLADAYRARVRAAQLKNHKSLKDLFGNKELEELKANYTDKEIVDAIDDAYKQKNFSKELNPVFRINEAAVELGYRQTLQISNLPGSGIREGLNSGFRGFSNLIRKAQHINITGAKYVMRNNEYVCVGFGLPENMLSEYGAVASEKAVNLGDTVNLLFNPSRAAVTMYEDIRNSQQQWLSNGGWEMMNKLESYATSYFPLINNPKRAAQRLASELGRNLDAYNDPQALWLANAASIESWVKRYAMENLNAAIQMSDISKIDERTTNTLNDIITTASVGTPVYSSNIVSSIQRTAYWATLWGNGSPMVGNLMSEPVRLIDYYGVKTFTKSFKGVISPKERARIKNIIGDLPSRFDDRPELVGLAAKAKSKLGTLFEFVETAGMTPLQKSEELKNLWFWKAAEINAKELFPNDKIKQIEHTLRMFNDTAIAGGMGTNPSMAAGSIGRLATVLKTFTIRNWDDFIEATERVGRGELGTRKWQRNRRSEDSTYNRYTSGNKRSFNKAAAFRFAGGSILRRYLLWLLVLGPLGRSIWDALGGDPTGLTENFSRGLYDDESTEYDEGMQPIDNFINMIPTGFILGTLKDIYFAARRAGVQTQNFLGIPDFEKDGRFQKDLRQHLPAGVVTRRLGDMLELMDRGYSTNSYGNKTYAAPESLADVFKGFLLGKAATTNAQAYNKYRYGSVDIWGDLFEGDWLDFAMSANPFASMGAVKFDSTRKDYTGVFRGGTNDIPTMQAAIADLRDRNKKIIDDYNKNLEAYTGEFQGLSTEDKKKLAIKKREKAIDTFTEDVTRLVDAFEDAGHSLSDKQINTMMWLFDFNEGDEETSDYTVAQQRYVEAGLPDVSPAVQTAKEKDGKVETQNYFDRSLIYQNAVQGVYGAGRGAAKAVKETLNEFKDVYKEYKKVVGDLQDKVFKKGISASEKKQRSKELEKVQNEYLEKLYAELTPVINKYGTSILSNNDVVAELQPYMSSMIPYSSIRKYGETFSSGNDIVWGQLSDWIQHRWGVGSPKEKSDQEVLDTINKIKALRNAGKVAQSKSEARALLERVARGSVKIRTKDLTTLRKLLNE